ncbi:vitellogenic carboxypeptidase-like [Hermetia illucens]|nr:vitellogenic carboxypeptidase-like [Hermetia illucens]
MTDNGNVQRRAYSWNNDFNIVYVDNPVGSGYSFTENDAGYAQNYDDVNRDLYEALRQLYKLFPQFENLPLYIAGSSYAGRFVISLGYKIHKTQEEATKAGTRPPVNIKLGGLAMGNAFIDPITQIDYGDNLFGLGLIDEDGLANFKKLEAEIRACIERNDHACVTRVSERLWTNPLSSTDGTIIEDLTGYRFLFKFVVTELDTALSYAWLNFVQQPSTRRAIHVGNGSFLLIILKPTP